VHPTFSIVFFTTASGAGFALLFLIGHTRTRRRSRTFLRADAARFAVSMNNRFPSNFFIHFLFLE